MKAYYFLRVTPGRSIAVSDNVATQEYDQAQMWVVNAENQPSAELGLQAILVLHAGGHLTAEHMRHLQVFPGSPARASRTQVWQAEQSKTPYFFFGSGPAVPIPELLQATVPQPIQPGTTQEAATPAVEHHADSERATEAGH